jgi:hypothetical protein
VASKILQSRCCSSRLAPNRVAKVGRQFTARDSRAHHSRGTEGSNPAPSSGESRANLKDRLNRREGLVLVQAVAGNAALPDEIMAEVFERAGGPLFLEELTPAGHWSATRCFPLKATLFGRPSTDNGWPTYRDGSGNAADRPKSLHIALHGAGTRRPFGEMPPMRP